MAQQNLRMLRNLLDSTPARILARDRRGRFLFVNRSAAALVGASPKQLLGKTIRGYYPPQAARKVRALDRLMFSTKKPVEREVALFGRTFLSLRVPLTNAAGKTDAVGIVATDITELKKIELALRQNEERYRLLTENFAGSSILMIDPNGRIVDWNRGAQRVSGLPALKSIERPYSSLFTKADVAKGIPQKLMAQAKRSGRAEALGWELRRNGSSFWARVKLTALRDDNGNLRGFAHLSQDVSETRRLEENLDISRRIIQASEGERRRIAQELHDGIGNILSSAKFTLHSLESDDGNSKRRVSETAARTAAILGDAIKEVRRIIRNLRPALLDDLGLVPALRNLCDDFKARTGARVRFRSAAVPGRLPNEVELCVYRVAQEAIGNAAEHSRTRSLSVALRVRGARLILDVRDTGRGFRIAYRGRERRLSTFGVVNMKERAALLGGEVKVESRPGKGTRVHLELPI